MTGTPPSSSFGPTPTTPDVSPRAYRWLAGGLLVTLACAASYRLGAPSLWLDEGVTWFNSGGSWSRLVERVLAADDMGGLLFAPLFKLWIDGVGRSEAILRLPSVIGILGLVWLAMLVARTAWDRRTALVVGAVTVIHPSIISLGRQVRGYPFALCLTVLCVLGLVWQLQRRRHASRVLLGVSSLLVAAIQVFGVFVAAGTALASLAVAWWHSDRRVSWRLVVDAIAPFVPAAAFAVVWRALLASMVQSRLETLWIHGTLVHNIAVVFAATALPLLAGVGLRWLTRRASVDCEVGLVLVLVALPVFLGPIALSFLVRAQHNFVTVRYALPLVPLATIACGAALARAPRLVLMTTLVAGLAASAAYTVSKQEYTTLSRSGQATREAAEYLKTSVQPGDEVRVVPEWEWYTLAYYQVPYLAGLPDVPRRHLGETALPAADTSATWWVLYNGRTPETTGLDATLPTRAFGRLVVMRAPRTAVGRSENR